MSARRPRIAYLTYGSGQYDARTLRMARSAIAAGYDVTVYARWYAGLPVTEVRDGFEIVRAPFDWQLAVPGLRGRARRRVEAAMRTTPALPVSVERAPTAAAATEAAAQADEATDPAAEPPRPRRKPLPERVIRRILRRPLRLRRRWWKIVRFFPLYGLGWASGLETVARPADLWHGMWAGSLPALVRMRERFGGVTIYDSRDVYMQSRSLADAGAPGKPILEWIERRLAHRVDRVVTVNDGYADLLTSQLRIPRPLVVMNVPGRWVPPDPPPDLIRDALGLPPTVRVVLYQGGLMTGRGIEQAMDAILDIPDAVLALLGFGARRGKLISASAAPPYAGKVFVLDPVPPRDLLAWTASADVSVMAIQPTSVNHRFTTPQKLFESIAAGVPVVASDLPGMAGIVGSSDIGVLCDPTSPESIAAAIRALLDEPPDERRARRARLIALAHERYNWEIEIPVLIGLYRELLGTDAPVASESPERAA